MKSGMWTESGIPEKETSRVDSFSLARRRQDILMSVQILVARILMNLSVWFIFGDEILFG